MPFVPRPKHCGVLEVFKNLFSVLVAVDGKVDLRWLISFISLLTGCAFFLAILLALTSSPVRLHNAAESIREIPSRRLRNLSSPLLFLLGMTRRSWLIHCTSA